MEQFWSEVESYAKLTEFLIACCYVLTVILFGMGVSETISARIHKNEEAFSMGWRISFYAASAVLGCITTGFVIYLQQ